jgi:hypothetical protein
MRARATVRRIAQHLAKRRHVVLADNPRRQSQHLDQVPAVIIDARHVSSGRGAGATIGNAPGRSTVWTARISSPYPTTAPL